MELASIIINSELIQLAKDRSLMHSAATVTNTVNALSFYRCRISAHYTLSITKTISCFYIILCIIITSL
jgi:hypothetical protein